MEKMTRIQAHKTWVAIPILQQQQENKVKLWLEKLSSLKNYKV